MAWNEPFLFGPLGGMVALPGIPVAEGVDVNYVQGGGIARALRGRATQDVWSTDRVFTFGWPLTRAVEARRLVGRYRGLTTASLRLLDPMGTNLLPTDVSVCGSEERLAPDTGLASWATPSGGTATLTGDFTIGGGELTGGFDVGTQWVATAAGQTLYACDAEWRRIPVLGRAVTFSAYAFGAGTVTPRIWPRTASGGYGAVVAGAPVVLNNFWQRLTVTLPAGSTAPGAHLDILAAGAATVTTVAWQAEHGATTTPWQIGGNSPEVLIRKFGDGYRTLGYRALELELEEV